MRQKKRVRRGNQNLSDGKRANGEVGRYVIALNFLTLSHLTLSSATWPLTTRKTTRLYIGPVLMENRHKMDMNILLMGTALRAALIETEGLTWKTVMKRMILHY